MLQIACKLPLDELGLDFMTCGERGGGFGAGPITFEMIGKEGKQVRRVSKWGIYSVKDIV